MEFNMFGNIFFISDNLAVEKSGQPESEDR